MQVASRHVRRRWTKAAEPKHNPHAGLVDAHNAVLGAREVHDAICAPPVETFMAYEIANSIVPARYVSGDFALTFESNGARFVVLGDLMGKGLSAAMWLTHVVDLVFRASEFERDLSQIMARLNREMHRSRLGVPLTSMFVARLQPDSSTVQYSCGGCPAAFLLRTDMTVTMLDCGGPIMGAVDGAGYETGVVEMSPGDTMLAISDGILEVHHGATFELKPERVARHMRHMIGRSALAIVQTLTTEVRRQSPAFVDDLSVVAIKHN